MVYLILFYEFFKAGLFAVGGGLATLPFLLDMANNPSYAWITPETLADMVAVSESTPGPLGVNMATYAGFQAGGVLGGIVATFALVLPSYIIIIIVAHFLNKYKENALVKNTFMGLRPAVAGLIAAACWSVLQLALFRFENIGAGGLWDVVNLKPLILFAALLALTNIKPVKKLHPIAFIGFAAAAGIVFRF